MVLGTMGVRSETRDSELACDPGAFRSLVSALLESELAGGPDARAWGWGVIVVR